MYYKDELMSKDIEELVSIAKEIVLKHGGTIKAESAEDTVMFTIVLPLKFT